MLEILITILLFWILFLVYMTRNNSYWKQRGVPYVNPRPIFGNMFDIVVCKTSTSALLRKLYEKHAEPYMGFFFLDQPCLLVNDLGLIKRVLVEDFQHFESRSMQTNQKNDPVGSKLLFFSEIPSWKQRRKDISPAYSSAKLKSQTLLLPADASKLLNAIKEEISKGKRILNVKDFADKYTVNTISSAFFGMEGNSFKNENSPFVQIFDKMTYYKEILSIQIINYMFIAPSLVKMFRIRFADEFYTKFLRKFSWDLLNERDRSNGKNNDAIDVLLGLKRKENISNPNSSGADMLAAHVGQIFGAGFETTGTALSYVLFELAKNPDCQTLARQEAIEIHETFGEFTYTNVQSMKYLKNCLLETLRMYPISAFLNRRCTKTYKIPGSDVVLENGLAIFISIWGIQNDPKYYPDPSQFDPDRFTEETVRKRPDFCYLPFGEGPRTCQGQRFAMMSSLIALATILLNYELKLPEGTPRNIHFSNLGILIRPNHGVNLEFVEIK